MRFSFAFVALVLFAAPAPAADDLSPLHPENTIAVLSIDLVGVSNSPLGKKMIGTDKPFTASRKLVSVLLDDDTIKIPERDQTHLAGLANKLERVTFVVTMKPGGFLDLSAVGFLEGGNTEDDYIKAVEGFAKAEKWTLDVEKRGAPQLLVLEGSKGASVNKSLFVISNQMDLITETLDKADGKQKPSKSKAINDAIKQVKPADTPIWLVIAHEDLGAGVATISLKDDAEFRIEFRSGTTDFSSTIKDVLTEGFAKLAMQDTRQGRVWAAAKIVVKQDGKTVTATGKFPGKLLAEEYAKQK